MKKEIFEILIFNGRVAAGKSEIIDYLEKIPVNERVERFHIGELEEFDDFPMLFDSYRSDNLLEDHGKERLFTKSELTYKGKAYKDVIVFKDNFYWDFLLLKLCKYYTRAVKDNPDYHSNKTAILEFSRGSGEEHGGWGKAYRCLSDDVLEKASTMYIHVTHEESARRNINRIKPGKEHTVLNHSLPNVIMETRYKESDWEEFSSKDPNYLLVKDHKIPYAVFNNMPDKTLDPKVLGPYLEEVLGKLWKIKNG